MAHAFNPEMDKALTLPDNSQIGHLPKDPNIYVDRSTIYYGASGTGKSTAIRQQLWLLKTLIPNAVAFAPTNDVNNTYTGVLPKKVIHSVLNRDKIEKIFREQEKKARLYTLVNSVDRLRPIFQKMKDISSLSPVYYRVLRSVEKMEAQARQFISNAGNNSELSFSEKKSLIGNAKKKCMEKSTEIYKNEIIQCRTKLLAVIDDPLMLTVIKYINMNPRLLLILDDCIDEIVAMSGKSKNKRGEMAPSIMDTIFTRGRWAYITIIIATQDDNKVTTTMRKNSYVSIFTDGECASHFMENKANSIMKDKRKRALLVCEEIFSDNTETNYKKMVYYRLGNKQSWFTYIIADLYDNFKFGSDDLWNLCSKVEERSKNQENQFLSNLS